MAARNGKWWARMALVLCFFPTLIGAPTSGAQAEGRRFPETGQTVRGRFLQYWEGQGGLAQHGYPLSAELLERSATDGRTYTVQYFERAVFEHHPENAPPYDVLLALVGAQAYAERYPQGAPGQQPNTAPGSLRFAETGKRLGGAFLAYWQAHGGLMQQGFPLSDEFTEVSAQDGRPYRVQYFERAVFELHPENAGTEFEVLPAHLGARRYQARYAGSPAAGPGTVAPIAAMAAPRACHTATLLPTGKVLVASGMRREGDFLTAAELFDPATNTWAPTGALAVGRSCHTATLLRDGTVLITGGSTRDWLDSAEIYTPATGRFTPTGALTARRGGHTATLLPDGTVLIAGGFNGSGLTSAEIYNPTTRRFTPTGAMRTARSAHSATLLPSGKVLVAGGGIRQDVTATAELYDPATGTWAPTGPLAAPRHKHAAHLLPGGKVLIVGGSDNRDWRGRYTNTEVYDPTTGAFQANGLLAEARFKLAEAVAPLPGGRLLVAGGGTAVEVYDPATRRFTSATGQIDAARFYATATALPDGRVLILGGYDQGIVVSAGAWLYTP